MEFQYIPINLTIVVVVVVGKKRGQYRDCAIFHIKH
jgi:hypothetical protein